jgi:flagellar M-ring protein FliF
MEFLNQLRTQLTELWGRWSRAQQVGMLCAVAACIASIVAVGLWTTTPEYVTLTNQLTPQEAAEVIATLEGTGIRYRLNYSGSAISVPKGSLNRARVALKDVLGTSGPEAEALDNGLWADPSLNHVRQLRQLEGRLGRSISQMRSVRSATVHITQPESTPFVREQAPAKASVILDLKPNSSFSGSDARSIISLVAHSVEKLTSENVTVLDTEGRLLSSPHGMEADVSGQLNYRTRLEADLAGKAETMLTQMLGPGRAVVRVTADVDFTELQRTQTTYDPDTKVKIREEIRSESLSGSGPGSSGAAGAGSNVSNLQFQAGGPASNRKLEENTTEYANAETRDSFRELPGRVKRLTVAAVVHLADPEQEEAAAAGPLITREQVESIIKQAVGFDAARQDAIEVLAAPLNGFDEFAPPVGMLPGWEQYAPLIRMASLGIASLVALVLGMMLIRRLKPIVVETSQSDQLPAETILRIRELSEQTKANPEAAASVLRAWLDEPEENETRKKAAA